MNEYPDESGFVDYHDFYANVLMLSYFYLVERSEFDYTVIQDRYDCVMEVGFPELRGMKVELPKYWTAAA